MMKTKVRELHFSIDSALVVEMTRQAYWMENRQDWALETLRCYEGISEQQIMNILIGVAVMENHPDGKRAVYVEHTDLEWQEKLAKHLEWQDSLTYCFAGHRVPKDLVDFYVENIVRRLRDAMRMPIVARHTDPLYLLRLEEQRRRQHDEIFLAAGFSRQEVEERSKFNWSPEFTAFDKEFSAYLDKQTNWLTGGE
jgi:hypothetical protein